MERPTTFPMPPEHDGPIGVLGGTFDPVHRAHLHLARAALRQLGLARVLWVPAGQPYHRRSPHASADHRLAMVRIAIAGEPAFEVDDTEILSGEPSYTVPALERLRREYGDERPLVLILGADAFLGLPTWHRWREIFGLARVAVAARPGFDPAAAGAVLSAAPPGGVAWFEIDPVEPPDLSATLVRGRLRSGADPVELADLLPPGVLDYIRSNHLYST